MQNVNLNKNSTNTENEVSQDTAECDIVGHKVLQQQVHKYCNT